MENILFITFLGCAFVQMVYWSYFFSGILAKPKPTRAQPLPSVSVLICSHNNRLGLENLLPALMEQDHPDFEVIVVDDRSTDGTWEMVMKFSAPKLKSIKIEQTPEDHNPKKFAILQGIEASAHGVLVLTDSDCMPSSNSWLSEMASCYSQGTEVVLGYGKHERHKGLLNAFIRFETLFTGVKYLSMAMRGRPYMGVGRNLSYQKKTFIEKGGFGQTIGIMGGDDDLLVQRIATKKNTSVCISPKAQTITEPKKNFAAWVRQKKRHLSVGKYYSTPIQVLLGIYDTSLLIFYVLLSGICMSPALLPWAISIYFVRLATQITVLHLSGERLEDRIHPLAIPLFDVLYGVYIVVVGVISVATRQEKWN